MVLVAPVPLPGRRRARGGDAGPQVWLLDLTDPGWDVSAEAAALTDAEFDRARRAAPEVRRRRVLLRAGLRRVLGTLLGVPPHDVPLRDDRGRPWVGGSRVQVSCSASDGVGLVAVADGVPVGVDVQRHRDAEALQGLDEGWLAPVETRALALLPDPVRLTAVTRCWTQKEAVLKGRGVGLLGAPHEVVTPVAAVGRSGPWSLAPVPVPAGFVASLAVHRTDPLPGVRVHPLLPGGQR